MQRIIIVLLNFDLSKKSSIVKEIIFKRSLLLGLIQETLYVVICSQGGSLFQEMLHRIKGSHFIQVDDGFIIPIDNQYNSVSISNKMVVEIGKKCLPTPFFSHLHYFLEQTLEVNGLSSLRTNPFTLSTCQVKVDSDK